MCARELRLNVGPRYSKQSDRLVLEEHGHCEVPAGCGGVVIRWRNPQYGMPVVFSLFVKGDQQIFLDGAPLTAGRLDLLYGEHVLAFRLTNLPAAREMGRKEGSLLRRLLPGQEGIRREQGLLLCAAECSSQPRTVSDVLPKSSQLLVSRDDGSWKVFISPLEGDLWFRADFDDTDWPSLVQTAIVEPGEKEYGQKHRYEWLVKMGAVALGIQGEAQSVYIRKKFRLTPEGIQ